MDSLKDEEFQEKLFWKGSPSQWVNATRFFLCILTIHMVLWAVFSLMNTGYGVWTTVLLTIPILIALGYWWGVKSIVYEITSQRVICTTGVFKRTIQYLELYRVRDMTIEQPFIWRMLGIYNLTFLTTDNTTPNTTLWAIRADRNFQQKVRTYIEESRSRATLFERNI